MKKLLLLLPVLSLAACMENSGDTVAAPPEDACGASKYQNLVGQSDTVLKNITLPAGTRVIQPNSPVTMDLRPDRLNIEIGKDHKISRVACF